MHLHLSWDDTQGNGIVFSEEYPWGALYHGVAFKPKLSFEYDSLMCSDVFTAPKHYTLNGVKYELQKEKIAEIFSLAEAWVQPRGQEGNSTKLQKEAKEDAEIRAELEATDWYVIRELEGGLPMPTDVKNRRQKLRDSVKHPNPHLNVEFSKQLDDEVDKGTPNV